MTERTHVTTKEELVTLDQSEIVEGYLDGIGGELSCGDNRSKSYWHGFQNGQNDRLHKVKAYQVALINDIKRPNPSSSELSGGSE